MRKWVNIAAFIALLALSWGLAGLALTHLGASNVVAGVRYIAGVFVTVMTLAGQMLWKVHDATKATKLPRDAERRLQLAATLISRRLWAFIILAIIGTFAGFTTAAFPQDSTQAAIITRIALALSGILVTYTMVYFPWLYFDLVALDRKLGADSAASTRRSEILERMRKE